MAASTSVEVKTVEQHHYRKPFAFHGRLGGAFNVEGDGFGDEGTLLISERHIDTTSWGNTLLKGQLPPDIVPGPVKVNGKVIGVAVLKPEFLPGVPSLVLTTLVAPPPVPAKAT